MEVCDEVGSTGANCVWFMLYCVWWILMLFSISLSLSLCVCVCAAVSWLSA